MTQSNQANDIDPNTLDESYQLAISALDSSSREMSSADTRLIGAFVVASIIIGMLPIVQGDVVLTSWYWPDTFVYSALAAYLWTGFWVYQGFRAQEYYAPASFEPRLLRENYWHLDEPTFKTLIYEYVERAYAWNRRQLNRKKRATYFVGPAVAMEIVFLLTWTFTRIAYPFS